MTYEEKLKDCKKRLIPFQFSKEEWEDLNKLKHQVNCAYTNVKFIHKVHHAHQPSLERIDDSLGYTKSNCVWVTNEANNLKSRYIENNGDRSKLQPHELTRIKRIERILSDAKNLNEIRQPYIELFGESIKETPMENNQDNINPEITLATMYSAFGKEIEGYGCEFNLTYSDYKKLVLRKKCQLTNTYLSENVLDRVLWVVDKSKPVEKSNVKVCNSSTRKGLDFLQANAKLSVKDLINLGKNLTKVK